MAGISGHDAFSLGVTRTSLQEWSDFLLKLFALVTALSVLLGGLLIWLYLADIERSRYFRDVVASPENLFTAAFFFLLVTTVFFAALAVAPLVYREANALVRGRQYEIKKWASAAYVLMLLFMMAVPVFTAFIIDGGSLGLHFTIGLFLMVPNFIFQRCGYIVTEEVNADTRIGRSRSSFEKSVPFFAYGCLFLLAYYLFLFPFLIGATLVDMVEATSLVKWALLIAGLILYACIILVLEVTTLGKKPIALLVVITSLAFFAALLFVNIKTVAKMAGIGGYKVQVAIDSGNFEGGARLPFLRASCGFSDDNQGRVIEVCAEIQVSAREFLILDFSEFSLKIPTGAILYEFLGQEIDTTAPSDPR